MTHAASAIQKNTSEIVVNGCQPVSTAVANVAEEYMPSGNTAAHQLPTRIRTVAAASTGIHALATIHVTIVTGRMSAKPALSM